MKVTVILILIGALGAISKRLVNGQEDLKIRGGHLNYSIIKISQNAEKCPGDLRRLTIAQTPMEDHQLTLV